MRSFVIIIHVVILLAVSTAQGEVWQCLDAKKQKAVITNTPVETVSNVECVPFSLAKAPFKKVSPEAFARLASGAENKAIRSSDDSRWRGKSENNETINTPPQITWKAEEFGSSVGAQCRFSGAVAGDTSWPIIVSVSRGALSINEKKLYPDNNKKWEMALTGRCMEPKVTVRFADGR